MNIQKRSTPIAAPARISHTEFILKRSLLRGRPLAVNEFEKVEAERDSMDPDQIAHVLDVIDDLSKR